MTRHLADAGRKLRHVFLHDMLLMLCVGVSAGERTQPQRVRLQIDLAVDETAPTDLAPDDLANVVDYDRLAQSVRAAAHAAPVKLLETLAERLAAACFGDARVAIARVRVEKLDVFADVGAAGVEIERHRRADRPPPAQTPPISRS